MSQANPYEASRSRLAGDSPWQVSINPIELYKRSLALMGDQYWLFVGMSLVAMLIASVVPFGILMGPMFVGLHLAFKEREEGRQVEFGKIFEGFDQFGSSLVVTLIMMLASIVVAIPAMLIMMVSMFAVTRSGAGNAPPDVNPIIVFGVFFGLILLWFCVLMALYVPFLFAYQLVADRKLGGGQAFSMSFKASLKNLGGVLIFLLFSGIVSMLAAMLCYFPAFLVMPITFGALWILYRDVFGYAAE